MDASGMAREMAPGVGVPIEALIEEARQLSPLAFEERHGPGFLLCSTSQLRDPEGPHKTVPAAFSINPHEATGDLALAVYFVRRTGRSVFNFVTVGRTANNDVVIPDVTVSRFHALFKVDEAGVFALQDAGSKNGTSVNGKPVPANGKGPPAALASGDGVRFGSVDLTFLNADALRDYLVQFGR